MSALLDHLSSERRRRRLRTLEKHRRVVGSGGDYFYDPSALVALVPNISSWLRVEGATVTGIGVSSLPDVINANPAVQATNTLRPVKTLSANSLPIMTFDGVDDALGVPLITANNAAAAWGMAFWIRPTSVGTPVEQTLFAILDTLGATANKAFLETFNSTLALSFYAAGGLGRSGTTASSTIVNNTWAFVTSEWDGAAGTEANKVVLTVDTTIKALTFTGTGTLTGVLPQPTGVMTIGNLVGLGSRDFKGQIGPNIWVFNSKMAGATQGILTTGARTTLMAFDQPT